MTFTKFSALSGFALMASASMAFAECGDITIAEMNWASAELMANVDALILSEGYGCDVELISGATNPTFTSMNEKGQPDVAPELWINAVMVPLTAALEEGRLVSALEGPIQGAGEGWWVTRAFAEAYPELDTVEKIIERPDLFPYAEDESLGGFMGCPSGWGCQLSNAQMFRAFDMEEKGWTLIDPGSAAGLDGAIAKASERGEYWFGYYWAPTALIGKYDLQPVPFETGFAGQENWDTCIVVDAADCPEPAPTSYITSEIHTIVTADLAEKAGEAASYFENRAFSLEAMNAMLVYMTDNQASGEDAAYEFLETMPEVWTQWVPADVAEKVMKAL